MGLGPVNPTMHGHCGNLYTDKVSRKVVGHSDSINSECSRHSAYLVAFWALTRYSEGGTEWPTFWHRGKVGDPSGGGATARCRLLGKPQQRFAIGKNVQFVWIAHTPV